MTRELFIEALAYHRAALIIERMTDVHTGRNEEREASALRTAYIEIQHLADNIASKKAVRAFAMANAASREGS